MGNRSEYWCKRRVRLTPCQPDSFLLCAFVHFTSLHFCAKPLRKKLPVTWGLGKQISFMPGTDKLTFNLSGSGVCPNQKRPSATDSRPKLFNMRSGYTIDST
jgi:hypothetical protein